MKLDFLPNYMLSEYAQKRERKAKVQRWILSAIVVISLLSIMAYLDSDKDELQAAHEHTMETIKAAKLTKISKC